MNLEEYPEPIKKDIEDQSLFILEHIADDIIVIGGWRCYSQGTALPPRSEPEQTGWRQGKTRHQQSFQGSMAYDQIVSAAS